MEIYTQKLRDGNQARRHVSSPCSFRAAACDPMQFSGCGHGGEMHHGKKLV